MRAGSRLGHLGALGAAAVLFVPGPPALGEPASPDPRIRVAPYAADEVYRLRGYAGYQIDLEFEPGESFVGLGAGDLDSLAYAAEANHLFLKPRAPGVDTNLTVLTNRRAYHFDYASSEHRPDPATGEVIYTLRFVYPAAAEHAAERTERRLAEASAERWHNRDYGYRGSSELKPESAWDDGVQTRLRFGARRELPALFVRNDDGSESLLNFTVVGDEVLVHRVARQFIVRRGRLEGCIVNEGFTGAGERLKSGTVAPDVERVTRGDGQ
jgi:type IV secretion system protein VirB9